MAISTVTVLLAWMFLRERLQWSQWLGVGIIFIGIVLVNS
jgi:drug/metabolite transporter (DMT)-like permease